VRRRHRPRSKLFCGVCGKPRNMLCSLGHKYRLPARDRRKIQEER
jgi:hypothetical protein